MTAYVDPIAVERACRGDRVYLRPIERRAAVQRLTTQGVSGREIARILKVSDRTVWRCRGSAVVEIGPVG